MSQRPYRLRRILEALTEADVQYVLVGGLAVVAWGNERFTKYVDLVPDSSPANLTRLAETLVDLGGKVKVGERRLASGSIAVFLKSGDITLIETELGQVDVLQGVPHIPRYDQVLAESEIARIDGVEVRVCSLRHLVDMKRAAGRPQDIADLDALRSSHPDFDWESVAEPSSGGGSGER